GHFLQRFECQIFFNGICTEKFFDNDDLIMNLAEPREKIGVRCGGMNFVTEFLQSRFGSLKPFWSGKCDERRLVGCGDKVGFKSASHKSFQFEGWSCAFTGLYGRRFHFERTER